jgi:hypothetical protein
VINMGIDFIGGLLIGASCAFLTVGVVQWFSSRRSRLGPDPLRTNGVVTKVEQRILNGTGLICAVSQAVITLFFALIVSGDTANRYLVALVIAWFAASLMLGVILAVGGYRSETISCGIARE